MATSEAEQARREVLRVMVVLDDYPMPTVGDMLADRDYDEVNAWLEIQAHVERRI